MENLPVPKRPRDNLLVLISVLTVVIILAVVGQPTSSDMTVITAAVVGLLTSWTRFGQLGDYRRGDGTATPMSP